MIHNFHRFLFLSIGWAERLVSLHEARRLAKTWDADRANAVLWFLVSNSTVVTGNRLDNAKSTRYERVGHFIKVLCTQYNHLE